jgi:hypothetical protein
VANRVSLPFEKQSQRTGMVLIRINQEDSRHDSTLHIVASKIPTHSSHPEDREFDQRTNLLYKDTSTLQLAPLFTL